MSDEARAVVDIILESPEEMMAHLKGNTAPCGQRMRKAMQRLLKDRYNWQPARIRHAFAEIEQALA